jgi:hypothetical protein
LKTTITETGKGKLVRINSELSHGIILERKIDDITSGLQPEFSRILHTISGESFNDVLTDVLKSVSRTSLRGGIGDGQ